MGSERPRVPVPPPADEDFAALDARVRLKLDLREPLDDEERRYLARTPSDKEFRYEEIED